MFAHTRTKKKRKHEKSFRFLLFGETVIICGNEVDQWAMTIAPLATIECYQLHCYNFSQIYPFLCFVANVYSLRKLDWTILWQRGVCFKTQEMIASRSHRRNLESFQEKFNSVDTSYHTSGQSLHYRYVEHISSNPQTSCDIKSKISISLLESHKIIVRTHRRAQFSTQTEFNCMRLFPLPFAYFAGDLIRIFS